ncbi:hypothetical protein FW781_18570 [Chryseobacterium panacisoli]|uniref:Uncharacterized protein n=1 Tax=Chryseobacterium panacisoli TaxID=1807141 RepID=A0A5D8ZGI3_9FLAO|nr:hypothetical protein [Chryseobacterium panacisoli]TZF93697.1 hypothetical protein FW781_18570 [Chryseobacterium panacisoli]
MNRELIFLRTFAFTAVIGIVFLAASAFKTGGHEKFTEIDVERINIVEKDGTVKMIITNAGKFPNGEDKINGSPTNKTRKKRSGMLFFNEDGIECGGFIYDGQKNKNGHSSGLSLTYDQYDGDQVMQLLTQDYKKGDKRVVASGLYFNDRPTRESQIKTGEILSELSQIKDPEAAQKKYKEYEQQGLIGGAPRMMLGKTKDEHNGLFLFDSKGQPRARFCVDKNNEAKLDFLDDEGNVTASFPEKKK